MNVSNSLFVNTSASQGGAFNIECMEVIFNLLESIFLLNNATSGNGGAVLISGHSISIRFLNSSFTNSLADGGSGACGGALFVTSMVPSIHSSIFQANHSDKTLLLTVERCRFIGCRSENGGSLYVEHSNHLQLVIKHSDFIFNYAYRKGAALETDYKLTEVMTDDCLTRKTSIVETSIENSTFSRNEAALGSALCLEDRISHQNVITLDKVIMHSNSAWNTATAYILGAYKLKASQSRFLNNRAAIETGGIEIMDVRTTEVADSIFDGNYVEEGTYSNVGGGALMLLNYYFDRRDYDSAFVFIMNSTFNNCSGHVEALFSYSRTKLYISQLTALDS